MTELVKETLETPNLEERSRLRDLVTQMTMRRISGLTNNAHGLAMMAAAARFRRVPEIQFRLSGLEGIASLKQLNRVLEQDAEMDAFVDRLQWLVSALAAEPKRLLVASDGAFTDEIAAQISALWCEHTGNPADSHAFGGTGSVPEHQAWITNTQVNFCAQAHPTVAESHPDSAPLSVLAGILRNAFLHSELREKGGAYGGGATHDSSSGVFRFYSYRDPNVDRTFDTFDEAARWIAETDLEFAVVEESVLGLIAAFDAPGSPAGEAKQAFQSALFGRSPEHRREMRRRVLDVSVDDVKRVAAQYLGQERSRAVVTNEAAAAALPADFECSRI